MDDELRDFAAAAVNHVFTTAQAEAAGFGRLMLVSEADAGRLLHLTRGVWTAHTDLSPTELHVLRSLGMIRRLIRDTGADACTALLLHDLPVPLSDLSRVHLARRYQASTRLGAGFAIRGAQGELTTTDRHPLLSTPEPVVPVADAIVRAGLLGPSTAALVAADAAVRAGLTDAPEIARALDVVPQGAKGIASVRWALNHLDARHESPGESLTTAVCARLGYELDPQVAIGPYRVDFVVRGTRVVIELDSALKDSDRADLVAEKRREDQLRALGYVVVRLMWRDLLDPRRVRAKIEQALAQVAEKGHP